MQQWDVIIFFPPERLIYFLTVWKYSMCLCGSDDVPSAYFSLGLFFSAHEFSALIRLYCSSRLIFISVDSYRTFTFKWKRWNHLTYKCHVYEIYLLLRCSRFSQLTVVALVKDDELLPMQFRDKIEQDVADSNRWPCSQCVALSVWARVELTGSTGCAIPISLNEEVGDVHCICQRLQGTCSCTACRCNQREDPLVHQLACWTEDKKQNRLCEYAKKEHRTKLRAKHWETFYWEN